MGRTATLQVPPRPDPRQLSLVKDPDPRPFLKWVGGKTQLLEQLQPLLPSTFRRYFEPFVGGAAMFFDLRAKDRLNAEVHLSDVNAELIDAYAAIRDGRLRYANGRYLLPGQLPVGQWVQVEALLTADWQADTTRFLVDSAEYDARNGRWSLRPKAAANPFDLGTEQG